jgi:hypothetical protein
VHFCNIGGLNAARLQLSTDTVPYCISGLVGGSMMQKCTLASLRPRRSPTQRS